MQTGSDHVRQLSPTAAFGHVVKSTFHNLPFAFHLSWPWLLVIAPANILLNVYSLTQVPDNTNPTGREAIMGGLGVIIGLLTAFSFSSIAVSWHRYILLDEVPVGWARLRADSTVWRYFGNTILIALRAMVTVLPVMLLGGVLAWALGNAGVVLYVIMAVGCALWAFVLTYRLSIKLPAIALQRRDFFMGNALAASEGNFWQLLGLGFFMAMIFAAMVLVVLGVSFLQVSSGSEIIMAIGFAIQVLFNWVVTIMGVTLFTSLYGFFVEGREF
ncbi:MAG: hypothetical protein U1E15_13275 [Hyphomicrobiales bacterium]